MSQDFRNLEADGVGTVPPFPQDWDTARLTVEQAETKNMVSAKKLGPRPVPFGFMNDQWKALLAKMIEGDELWEYSTPQEAWESLAGQEGIALVREGRIIDTLVTAIS